MDEAFLKMLDERLGSDDPQVRGYAYGVFTSISSNTLRQLPQKLRSKLIAACEREHLPNLVPFAIDAQKPKLREAGRSSFGGRLKITLTLPD